jgi:hypothetical protein
LLLKVLKVLKHVKKSTVRMDDVRKYAGDEFHKECTLKLDVVVRWNSMVDMIKSVLALHG